MGVDLFVDLLGHCDVVASVGQLLPSVLQKVEQTHR